MLEARHCIRQEVLLVWKIGSLGLSWRRNVRDHGLFAALPFCLGVNLPLFGRTLGRCPNSTLFHPIQHVALVVLSPSPIPDYGIGHNVIPPGTISLSPHNKISSVRTSANTKTSNKRSTTVPVSRPFDSHAIISLVHTYVGKPDNYFFTRCLRRDRPQTVHSKRRQLRRLIH